MTDSNSPENLFEGHLEEGERILWQGKPDEKSYINRTKKISYVGTIGTLVTYPFVAYALWAYSELTTFVFVLLSAFFANGILTNIFFWPFLFKKRAARLHYALTDGRVLHLNAKILTSVKINELPELNLKTRDDGIGDIIFGKVPDYRGPDKMEFACLENAERVYKQILELKEKLEKADS